MAYIIDVELVAAEELRARIAQIDHRGVERIDFHYLMYISAGLCTHMVDFETFDCTQGSCLLIQPGQVHRFGDEQEWAGWLLIVRSDLLPPGQTEALSTYTHTSGALSRALVESLERMAHDATHATDVRVTNALLRSQFHSPIARLQLAHLAATADARVQPRQLELYQDFRSTAEREFRRWHAVAPYARQLGCSVKSLNRAALEVAGISAKKLLVARVVLEAKGAFGFCPNRLADGGIQTTAEDSRRRRTPQARHQNPTIQTARLTQRPTTRSVGLRQCEQSTTLPSLAHESSWFRAFCMVS